MPLTNAQKNEIHDAMNKKLTALGFNSTNGGVTSRRYRLSEWDGHPLQTMSDYLHLHLYCPNDTLKVHLELRNENGFTAPERAEIMTYSDLPTNVTKFQSLAVFYKKDPNPNNLNGITWVNPFTNALFKLISSGLKNIQNNQAPQHLIFESNRLTSKIDNLILFRKR